jgi:O-antigen/teichoic acid export membrane protein
MSERSPVELDPGSIDVDLAQVKTRSVRGLFALTSRTFFVYVISTVATFALTVFLSPEVYGTFFLVSAVINFLSYFSDIGLAAALIQKKERLAKTDLSTTFTIQQILVLTLVSLVFLLTPFIRSIYSLTDAGVFLLWALAISFILSSLKTIPTALLERDLEFDKLVIPQVAESIVFNAVAVYFAWQGAGVASFAWAVLARGVVGLVLIYIIKPWRPQLGINRNSLSGLLRFGLPYQVNSLMAVVKDDGMTLILGGIIGQTGLGYIGWANKWVSLPLRFFMDNITKVAFPAYARVQDDAQVLKRGVEKTLYFMVLVTLPIFVGMALVAAPLVEIIPRYSKWSPAIFPLYMYLINAVWASLSTPLTNTLNAIGRIKTTFKLMIMWTVLTWILMPILGIKYGYQGVAVAAALISFSSIIVLVLVRRYVKVDYWRVLRTPMFSSLIMGAAVWFSLSLTTGATGIVIAIVTGVLTYTASLLLIDRHYLIAEVNSVRRHLLK